MPNKSEKPYVLRAAEFVYLNIIEIKKQNPNINNMQALEIFMTTKEYDFLSSGEFHDRWFLDRICTHILAFEGNSSVEWFEGSYSDYSIDRRSRLGDKSEIPSRIKYKKFSR